MLGPCVELSKTLLMTVTGDENEEKQWRPAEKIHGPGFLFWEDVDVSRLPVLSFTEVIKWRKLLTMSVTGK